MCSLGFPKSAISCTRTEVLVLYTRSAPTLTILTSSSVPTAPETERALLLGMVLARWGHHRAHAWCQSAVVLLNLLERCLVLLVKLALNAKGRNLHTQLCSYRPTFQTTLRGISARS